MDLSKKERLLISNQLRILEKLYPEEADYYSKHRKAIENGYKLHYDWLFKQFDDEMPEEECREVIDILNMYRAITFSYQGLKDNSGIKEDEVHFAGFDGNNETNQYSYVHYFIIDLDRFNELKNGAEYPDFNSHFPMLGKYRKMLQTWKSYKNNHKLTKDQIKELLKE